MWHALGQEELLDGAGHTKKRGERVLGSGSLQSGIGQTRFMPGSLEAICHQCIETGIDRLDSLDVGLEQIDSGDLAQPEAASECCDGGVQEVHGAGLTGCQHLCCGPIP